MKYGAVLRAQVHAEALGLNPLENGEEGVSQLPEKRLEVVCERKKTGKKQVFPQGSIKAFPVKPYFFQKFLTSVGSKNSYFSI